MSDETIRVGDLVMVVRGCHICNTENNVGKLFVVEWVGETSGPYDCCGFDDGLTVAAADYDANGDGAFEMSDLKKINPPPVDETVRESNEVTA